MANSLAARPKRGGRVAIEFGVDAAVLDVAAAWTDGNFPAAFLSIRMCSPETRSMPTTTGSRRWSRRFL